MLDLNQRPKDYESHGWCLTPPTPPISKGFSPRYCTRVVCTCAQKCISRAHEFARWLCDLPICYRNKSLIASHSAPRFEVVVWSTTSHKALMRPVLPGTFVDFIAKHVSVSKDQWFSDHAPLTIDCDSMLRGSQFEGRAFYVTQRSQW